MNKIQVLIDAGEIDTTDLSPEGIIKAIKEIDKKNEEIQFLRNYMARTMGFAATLERILDSDINEFDRAKLLRQLVSEMRKQQ